MFQTTRVNEYVVKITVDTDIPVGWQHKTLALFDQHIDSPKHRGDLYKAFMDKALAKDRPIILGGDFVDAMQSYGDPRASFEDRKTSYHRRVFKPAC
jgi:hypothetical protein